MKKKTEMKILDAATEIFLQKGKNGARMQDIANKANINKAMLHYYFRSKDNLYRKVLSNQLNRFFDFFIKGVDQEMNFKELLRRFITNYIEKISKDRTLLKFIIWEISQEHGEALIDVIREKRFSGENFKEIIIRRINLAIRNDEIIEIEPIHLFTSVIGICVFPFFAKPILENVFTDKEILSHEFVEKRKKLAFNMIWNYIKKEH